MAPSAVRLERLAAIPVAVIRRQVAAADLARVVPACCGLAWQALRARQCRPGRNIAIYWDDAIRLEAGVECADPFEERDALVRSATPAGLTASTTHWGPYPGLGAAHRAVQDWCRSRGHRLAGPSWEIYGHWRSDWDQDPSRIRTDVYYLVAAAG